MNPVLVIYHMPHERLGTFEPALKKAGCSLRFLEVYGARVQWPKGDEFSAVVVMGGSMGVSQKGKYPFLKKEITLIRNAIKAKLPILGVCLGAQLVATALGAKVSRNPQKEIGWYPLMREPDADEDPLFEPFGQTETVFQWHGDTFELPKKSVRLASAPLCHEQAFRYGDNVYGFQFHIEVDGPMIHKWLGVPTNKSELASLRGIIDPIVIKKQIPEHVGRMKKLAEHVAMTFANKINQKAVSKRSVKRKLIRGNH